MRQTVRTTQTVRTKLKTFGQDTSGAVTVDWVVLTAAIVGLAMIVLTPIGFTTDSAARGVSDYISSIDVGNQ